MSAEAITSADASTEAGQLPKEFYDSVVIQCEPPPYMLNTPLRKRVYRTFITDRPAIGTLGQLDWVAGQLGCTHIEEPTSTTWNDRNTEIESTWEGTSIKISGKISDRWTKDDSRFTCAIVKHDDTVYQSYYSFGGLYEKQAPRSSGQTFEDLPFEQCSFYSVRDRDRVRPKRRSFRLWAEPDPDNENTLLAGERNETAYQVMAFRPNRGIMFRREHNYKQRSDTVCVWSHGGELMWRSTHEISKRPEVHHCNTELIKSECQKWAALDDASDADPPLAPTAFVQEKVTRDFLTEPGPYHLVPWEPGLLELMEAASYLGDTSIFFDFGVKGPWGVGSHSDHPEPLTDGTDLQASSESSGHGGDESHGHLHGHPPRFQDNVNEGGQPKRPRLC